MRHLSPLWGLGELVCRCTIHLSPRWGFVSRARCPTYRYRVQFYRPAHKWGVLTFIVDFRINETLQIGGLGKRNYHSTVWQALFLTAPMRCGFQPHLPGGASVYLFFEFTIVEAVRNRRAEVPSPISQTNWENQTKRVK